MKLDENWYVHAPWAQLVCCTEIPEDKLIKFMAVSNEVLDEAEASDDNFGDGVIPLPWTITDEKLVKYAVRTYLMEMVTVYMETILSNGLVPRSIGRVWFESLAKFD